MIHLLHLPIWRGRTYCTSFASIVCVLGLTLTRPVAAIDSPAPPRNPRSDGYGYNPRCIKRDISNYLTQLYATTDKIVGLINNSKTIASFQDTMQAANGPHGAGHFTVAGDPGSDFYTSPGGAYSPLLFACHC